MPVRERSATCPWLNRRPQPCTENVTYPLPRIVCGRIATFSCQYPPRYAALACRRDSACCNLLMVRPRDMAAPAALSSVVYRPRPRIGQPLVGDCPRLIARIVPRLLKFCCVCNRLGPSSFAARRVRLRTLAWARLRPGNLRAPGGAPPLMRLEREQSTHVLELMSAWSF